MSNFSQAAIDAVNRGQYAFCKFISANDVGDTGGHQSGFYIPKNVVPMIFNIPGKKGENLDRIVKIKWQGDFFTESRFVYYGSGTRNEYRLTRFGRGFPYLNSENWGNLLVISQIEYEHYEAFILSSDDEIEAFFSAFGMSPEDTNKLIKQKAQDSIDSMLADCFSEYLKSLKVDFPTTEDLAKNARNCFMKANHYSFKDTIAEPDKRILEWINCEYELFRNIEADRYSSILMTPFVNIQKLIDVANTILNRRKSRAGKSLEHHLGEIFHVNALNFDTQVITEDNKKPDFIFPGKTEYHNKSTPDSYLTFLASKTTCKDRWRQILNEADRIKEKHLFTLQQGISVNQLDEMYRYGVTLVIPKAYKTFFPKIYQDKILDLKTFVNLVKAKQRP